MALVEYVGGKPRKEDNVCTPPTGLVWGPGQVHEVDDAKASTFAAYPGVWRVVFDAEPAADEGKGKGRRKAATLKPADKPLDETEDDIEFGPATQLPRDLDRVDDGELNRIAQVRYRQDMSDLGRDAKIQKIRDLENAGRAV